MSHSRTSSPTGWDMLNKGPLACWWLRSASITITVSQVSWGSFCQLWKTVYVLWFSSLSSSTGQCTQASSRISLLLTVLSLPLTLSHRASLSAAALSSGHIIFLLVLWGSWWQTRIAQSSFSQADWLRLQKQMTFELSLCNCLTESSFIIINQQNGDFFSSFLFCFATLSYNLSYFPHCSSSVPWTRWLFVPDIQSEFQSSRSTVGLLLSLNMSQALLKQTGCTWIQFG